MLVVLMIAGLVGGVVTATLFGITQQGFLDALIAAPVGASVLTLIVALLLALRQEEGPELPQGTLGAEES
jgi:uncharacterized membrane protein YeaQ/YmgE (transglycosylase-associated protein family)